MIFDLPQAEKLCAIAEELGPKEAAMMTVYLRQAMALIDKLTSDLLEERALVLTYCDDPAKVGEDYSEQFYILAKGELEEEGLI